MGSLRSIRCVKHDCLPDQPRRGHRVASFHAPCCPPPAKSAPPGLAEKTLLKNPIAKNGVAKKGREASGVERYSYTVGRRTTRSDAARRNASDAILRRRRCKSTRRQRSLRTSIGTSCGPASAPRTAASTSSRRGDAPIGDLA